MVRAAVNCPSVDSGPSTCHEYGATAREQYLEGKINIRDGLLNLRTLIKHLL